MTTAYNPVFDKSDDSIFLELEWLHLLAAEGPLPADCACVLRGSRVWRMVHPRPRRFPTEAVAIVATTALFPRPILVEAPAHAATRMAEETVKIKVVDSQTNRPIAGAQLIIPSTGERKGIADAEGRIAVPLAVLEGPEVVVSKEGYRPFPLMTSQLRPGRSVFVGLARIPGFVPPDHIAVAPTAKPAAPTPHVAAPTAAPPTAKPRPTPRPEVWEVKPKVTPTPVEAQPEPEATMERPEATPKPAVKPAKPAKPAAKPAKPAKPTVAMKPAKKRLRTMRAKARLAPEPAGRYRVVPGDSLSLIAAKKYGNGRLWTAIFSSNRRRIDDPDLIYPGQLLRIPAERIARAAAFKRRVVVHSGDSLWAIAGHYLGDPTQWRAIYNLNRAILDDPRLIHPGQVLRLPMV